MTATRAIIAFLLCAVVPLAQPASAPVNETFADLTDEIEMVRSMAQTQRQALVRQNMVFEPAENQAFWPLYNEYRGEMAAVQNRLVRLVTDYAAQYETLTDSEAQRLLDGYLDYQSDALKVRQKYVKKLSKVLPGRKVARFFQVENKLDAIVNLSAASEIPLAR